MGSTSLRHIHLAKAPDFLKPRTGLARGAPAGPDRPFDIATCQDHYPISDHAMRYPDKEQSANAKAITICLNIPYLPLFEVGESDYPTLIRKDVTVVTIKRFPPNVNSGGPPPPQEPNGGSESTRMMRRSKAYRSRSCQRWRMRSKLDFLLHSDDAGVGFSALLRNKKALTQVSQITHERGCLTYPNHTRSIIFCRRIAPMRFAART